MNDKGLCQYLQYRIRRKNILVHINGFIEMLKERRGIRKFKLDPERVAESERNRNYVV